MLLSVGFEAGYIHIKCNFILLGLFDVYTKNAADVYCDLPQK